MEEVAPSFSRPTRMNSLDIRSRNSKEAHLYLRNLRCLDRKQEFRDDLVSLEAELRKAYVAKELQAQIAEKTVKKQIDQIQKLETSKSMKLNEQIELEEILYKKFERTKESRDYKLSLDEQVNRKEEEKWIMMKEERVEREILEEVDKIREESNDLKILESKQELMEIMIREKLIFDEMKEIRKEEELEEEEMIRLKELKYLKEIEERAENRRKLKEENIRKRERVLHEIANSLLDTKAENSEREELLADLIATEIKYELLLREEVEEKRRKETKANLAASLDEQIDFVERCKIRCLERDAAFATELMRNIMEDERVARFTMEARKRQQLRYQQDLLLLIEDRRRIREKEMLRIKKEIEVEREQDKIIFQRIKEERKKLLMQHAPIVADFISKDVLTPDELHLVNEFRKL